VCTVHDVQLLGGRVTLAVAVGYRAGRGIVAVRSTLHREG